MKITNNAAFVMILAECNFDIVDAISVFNSVRDGSFFVLSRISESTMINIDADGFVLITDKDDNYIEKYCCELGEEFTGYIN